MTVHSGRRPATKPACRYNGPQVSELAATILGAEDSIAERQAIVICRRAELNYSGSECFSLFSVTQPL